MLPTSPNWNFITHKTPKIGIFDSGIGGLLVTKAIHTALPTEQFIYIGDTANCPWGSQPQAQIINYTKKLSEFLLANDCNILVAACNTASSVAIEALATLTQTSTFPTIKLFNMIDPTIAYLNHMELNNYNAIGIIATKQTIYSQAYQTKILTSNYYKNLAPPQAKPQVISLATPMLVPLIEEGLVDHPATELILAKYLTELNLPDHSILILGCTHYPLVAKYIKGYYDNLSKNIMILDPTKLLVAQISEHILTDQTNNKPQHAGCLPISEAPKNFFYCTSESQFFMEIAKRLFQRVDLELVPLWR